jgi:hypothetical protein
MRCTVAKMNLQNGKRKRFALIDEGGGSRKRTFTGSCLLWQA